MPTSNKARAISRGEAIDIAYRARFAPSKTQDSAAHIRRIGYAQIDTISVVERAHHHIMWAGDAAYRPAHIEALETKPRRIFEYWAHAAAYLPIEDYRYCLPRMRRIRATGHEWFPVDKRIVDFVRDRITAEGALRAADFENTGGPRGPWWDWKPAKAALEFLFMAGELLVPTRRGFQKVYDLAERVLPPKTNTRFPRDDEMADWYVSRAAQVHGIFENSDIAYMRKDGKKNIADALQRTRERGDISPVYSEDGRAAWVASAVLRAKKQNDPRPVRIISPFDPYIIDRKRAARLLRFDYTIECYVPAAKRIFGYFALPVLWRGKPVGLIDARADRKQKTLHVNKSAFCFGGGFEQSALTLETFASAARPGLGALALCPEEFAAAFRQELASFADFNACASPESNAKKLGGLL